MSIEETILLMIFWGVVIRFAWIKHEFFTRIIFITAGIVAVVAWFIGV